MCRTCPLLHRTDICGVVQRLPRRVSVPQAQVRFLPPLLMKFTAMKILTLIIKKKWFDAILSGEKKIETREVRPTNTKYISYQDNNTGKVYKKDVDESVRMKTGISYSFYGMKQSDGMNRCLMLRGYENEAISNTNKVYPLSKWKKSDVMAYIKAKKLPEPISYNKNKSQGLTFLPEVFDYLRRHYPQDLEKIYKVFPLSRNILLRYDEEKRAAAQIQAK